MRKMAICPKFKRTSFGQKIDVRKRKVKGDRTIMEVAFGRNAVSQPCVNDYVRPAASNGTRVHVSEGPDSTIEPCYTMVG